MNATFTFEKSDVFDTLLSKDILDVSDMFGFREKELFHEADKVRKKYCGRSIYIRGLIEFSNHCRRSCLYCGLRKENRNIRRYRMKPEEIIKTAREVGAAGIKTVVLQSGDDYWYTAEMIAGIIAEIKKTRHMAVTLSLGERPLKDYALWKKAGADRYLLRHETANPELYKKLHPGQDFKNRAAILRELNELGYQTGAGCIVGLPGQTSRDLLKDILFLKELDVYMAGIGPFIPHPDTPLGNCQPGSLKDVLKMVAAVRIVNKDIYLPATTAVGVIDEFGEKEALGAGANVIMIIFTPSEYRQLYEIYPGRVYSVKKPEDYIADYSREWDLDIIEEIH